MTRHPRPARMPRAGALRSAGFALLLTAAILVPGPAAAGDSPPPWLPFPGEQAEEMAREGMQWMKQAIDRMLEAIPQYALPELTEDGDIILRRRQPGPELAPAPDTPREI